MIVDPHTQATRQHWDETFRTASVWPVHHPVSLCISNRKPPHETARNLFKEDRDAVMDAAAKHGFVCVSDLTKNPSSVSFIRAKR